MPRLSQSEYTSSCIKHSSPLASRYRPGCCSYRSDYWSGPIDTITIHCYVGQVTAAQGCNNFADNAVKYYNNEIEPPVSANYVVGKDGSIGVSVPENYRAWTTGYADKYGNPVYIYGTTGGRNDYRAITIETASGLDNENNYITAEAWTALLNLVTDICYRNGIPKLVWSTSQKDRVLHQNGCNMTVHRDYCAGGKTCPGPYIYSRLDQFATIVNERLRTGNHIVGYVVPPEVDNCDGTYSPLDVPTQIVNVVSIEDSLINDFIISSAAATKVEATLITSKKFKDYSWSYNITSLDDNKVISKSFIIKKKKTKLSIEGLKPNTGYVLEVIAVDDKKNELHSPSLHVSTLQDYPSAISGLVVDLNKEFDLLKRTCSVSFNPPKSWGAYAENRQKKGYRISLVVNGKVVNYNDSLITFNKSDATVNKELILSELADNSILDYENLLQLGIQSWVKDEHGNLIFNSKHPKCSKPIYLRRDRRIIGKLFLKIKNTYKRALLYRPEKK